AELGTPRNRHACLQAQDLDEVGIGNVKLRQTREQIAARLRRAGEYPFATPQYGKQVIADRLVQADALVHPAFRLGKPGAKHGLAIACRAQRDDCLQLLHAVDELLRAERYAEAVAAERLRLR